MYNLSKINGTDPQILIKTVSDVLLNGMLEETILVFLLFVALISFYFVTGSIVQALVRSSFAIMVLSLFCLWLGWISGWTFFIFVAVYALSLLIGYLVPDY